MTEHRALPKREEISAEFKWKLEDIYQDDSLWEKDFTEIKRLKDQITAFKGRLSEGPEVLLEGLRLCDRLYSLNDKVFVYSRMRRDEDNANGKYQTLSDRAQGLMVEVYSATSFITPEILSIPLDKLNKFINNDPGLSLYRFYIDELLREKPHVLSDSEEQLLAMTGEMAQASRDIFTMFNNADIKFGNIKDENGQAVELTKGRYLQFLESHDRGVREEAFKTLYSSYISKKNTLAAMMSANVKKDAFYAKVRRHESALSASLHSDNIPNAVYDNLINTIHANLPLLHRYIALRKRILDVPQLHMYDMYVPLVSDIDIKIPYDKGTKIVEESLSPLGQEYIIDMKQGMDAGWVDIYENQGKTGGAYSWGAYLTHPYVLLNYQDRVNDVFTLAHELGHAMHSFYSSKKQPYIYSEYKIFVAEVASTVNESLLTAYLLDRTKKKNERAYYINHYLEEFRGTVFRQVMFAEFEKMTHEKVEAGVPLTPELLCSMYRSLNELYFGPDVIIDNEIDMEWSRIPHFYNAFYVYKYATGFSAATSISQRILTEGQPAVDRYLEFLSGGGSDYPIELLKKAGVDLTTPEPVEAAMKVFEKMLDEMESLL